MMKPTMIKVERITSGIGGKPFNLDRRLNEIHHECERIISVYPHEVKEGLLCGNQFEETVTVIYEVKI